MVFRRWIFSKRTSLSLYVARMYVVVRCVLALKKFV